MFLLRTSILERMCGPLCDAVMRRFLTNQDCRSGDRGAKPRGILEYLEHANLFIVPLDNERHWYRYHHLFADLLRQRLLQQPLQRTPPTATEGTYVADLHIRASVWYQDNGMEREAFLHAVAAKDFDRAAGLAELAWPAMDGTFPDRRMAWLGKGAARRGDSFQARAQR